MSNEFKDWMDEQSPIERKIVKKYPFLISAYARDTDGSLKPEIKLPLMPLEILDGWLQLFYQMCDDIKEYCIENDCLDSIHFTQVKEKYGQLICCVYYKNNVCDDNIEKIVHEYASVSKYICAECGHLADVYVDVPLCSRCLAKSFQRSKCSRIEIDSFVGNVQNHPNIWRMYLSNYRERK